jgi:hypothetical protein
MSATNEKTKLRYTQKEWDYIESQIAAPVYRASEAINRRLGGGFQVSYPPADSATADRLERLFLELEKVLDEADKKIYALLEGSHVEVVE